MTIITIGIEFANNIPMRRFHDADPRHYGVTAAATQYQDFDCSLPFR